MRKGWDGEWKKWNGKKNGENSSPLTFLPVNGKRLQYRHLCQIRKQAGAELGQAQLKLGLDFTLIFCRFGLSRFGDLACGWIGS